MAGTRDYLSPEIFSVQLTSSDDVMVEETREKNQIRTRNYLYIFEPIVDDEERDA